MSRLIQVETRAGDPIPAGDATIVPLAKSYQLRFPGVSGGVIWNRPTSVVVQAAGGQEYLLPIRDITRQAQFAILGGSLIGVFLLQLMIKGLNLGKKKRRTNNE